MSTTQIYPPIRHFANEYQSLFRVWNIQTNFDVYGLFFYDMFK